MRRQFIPFLAFGLIAAACGDATNAGEQAPTAPLLTTTQPTTTQPTTASPPAVSAPTPWPADLAAVHQDWTIRVVERIPHDSTAFTQGLEMTEQGLLEGTGRRGESTLRRIDLESGTVIDVEHLDAALFGEGLTVSRDEVIQLTWEAGRALRYDASTLQPLGEFTYAGEGWGICAGADDLWMSDGTPDLQRRDPATFELLDSVTVHRDGAPIDDLNELECIGDHVAANIWKSDEILVIEPMSGQVVATIDARAITEEIGATDEQAALNGIADLGDGTLLLAGKLWPTLFIVSVEVAG